MKNLIEKDSRGNLTVSSLVVAEVFGRPHSNVLKSLDIVNKQIVDLKDEVAIYFVGGKDIDGRKTRTAFLTERQFLIAMPFIGGEKSLQGQITLVDEFIRQRSLESNKNRHIDAIRSLLLMDAPTTWVKLFPDTYYTALMELHNQKPTIENKSYKPFYCAQITRQWVYNIVLPESLQLEIDTQRGEERKHQWFTKDNGRETLAAQIGKVEMIARMSPTRADFEANCARSFLGAPLQLTVFKTTKKAA